jgi:vacuolar-type H+-ATPase catalytic subunit A/Vma1
MIRDLEKNVVYLSDLLNDQLMLDAEELTKSLREQQQALRDALEEYKTAPSEQKKQALLKAIRDIKKRMSEIISELSRIRGSIPQDFVNQDALKTEDTMQDLEQIENMIQEGNLDDAMSQLEKMLTGTEKMLSEMRDGRQELGEREYAEATKKAQELYRELGKIEKEQRELSRKTDQKAAKILERMKERLGDPEAFIQKQLERIKKVKGKLKTAESGAHFAH